MDSRQQFWLALFMMVLVFVLVLVGVAPSNGESGRDRMYRECLEAGGSFYYEGNPSYAFRCEGPTTTEDKNG